MKSLIYILTGNSITVLINNRPEIIDNSHPNFKKVEQALKDGKSENDILVLMNTGKAIEKFAEKSEEARGNIRIEDGEIYYKDEVVHSALATRIISLMENGFDITPFTNFMENLYMNPSHRAVTELYGFLEACNLPITEDGYFLAYKKIKDNYTDCYTGTINNSIGTTVSMSRYKVNEDKNQTCSTGLHVASYSYMSSYPGDRIVICKVNPSDTVSVPVDYNNAKMRVCKYIVVNEVALHNEEIASNVISNNEVYSESKTTKMKFTKVLENYLSDYNSSKWVKLGTFLINKGFSTGFITTGYDLRDYRPVIQKLKSMSKKGDFKKKNLLRELGI